MNIKYLTIVLAAMSGLLLTTGCVVEERPAPVAHVIVQAPPPADIVEVQIAPPDASPYWAWQKGHWRWNGSQYYWTKGHWAHRPEHYNSWVAPRWESRSGGYIFVEGHWQ